MFLPQSCTTATCLRFPRVCGDVPMYTGKQFPPREFSPRVRGCSLDTETENHWLQVFPACAGMFLPQSCTTATCLRFPRVCGDVPMYTGKQFPPREFSPRVRGCSCGGQFRLVLGCVFPACAGMFRFNPPSPTNNASFPRVCGDVPSSPADNNKKNLVFPACAGMFLAVVFTVFRHCRFPRVCGDVPDMGVAPGGVTVVFPACAGMFRYSGPAVYQRVWFSPRVRGCSERKQKKILTS